MNFRPPKPRGMWDTWIFTWEDMFHLFYLENYGSESTHVGHWVGKDLLHWEERASIPIITGKPGDWNESGPILTGMVVHHEGQFYLFAGATHDGIELTGVFLSDDLGAWSPYQQNPVFRPAAPYYLDMPAPPFFYNKLDFRDPFIFYRPEDGHYHALLHGRLPRWSHEHTGAVLAHMRSADLLCWEHLPPLDAPTGKFEKTEVPDLFEMEGRHYLAFTSRSRGGIRLGTNGRDNADGTFYAIADNWDGPFSLPQDYLLVGAEKGVMGPYVGHTLVCGHGRVLYHHVVGERTALATPKKVRVWPDGSLYLEYMPLLERLETETLCDPTQPLPCFVVSDWGEWEERDGRIRGKAGSMGSSCRIAAMVSDFHLTCTIRLTSAGGAGVVLRHRDRCGVWVFFNRRLRRIEMGGASYRPFMGWSGQGNCDKWGCPLESDKEYNLRCFARDEHFEVYLDDRWIFTLALADEARVGDIELFVERGEVEFSNVRLATIKPLE